MRKDVILAYNRAYDYYKKGLLTEALQALKTVYIY